MLPQAREELEGQYMHQLGFLIRDKVLCSENQKVSQSFPPMG